MNELKNKILQEYEKGNIVIADNESIKSMNLEEFITQDVDGILYDLNRIEIVTLTFINDPKWVNDYAVAQVIRALKSKLNEYRAEELKNILP
jgi:hypothetical protein